MDCIEAGGEKEGIVRATRHSYTYACRGMVLRIPCFLRRCGNLREGMNVIEYVMGVEKQPRRQC